MGSITLLGEKKADGSSSKVKWAWKDMTDIIFLLLLFLSF